MDFDILINPNVAYLLLVTGFVLGMIAIFSPGTGLAEIGTLLAFILAGWEIANLPFNWWALLILVLGVFPFLLAVRFTQKIYYLIISIVALVVGSVFLFTDSGLQPVVNPILAIVTSTVVVLVFWFVATKSLQAAQLPPSHDLTSLVGMIGEARTGIDAEGSVYVNGELWSARSNSPVPEGAQVRILERQGLILTVEPVQDPSSSVADESSQRS